MEQIRMRNNGSEAVLYTKHGEYVAYDPLEPGRKEFDVKRPDGIMTKMNKEEFLKLIIYNSPLERTPQKDCFNKTK